MIPIEHYYIVAAILFTLGIAIVLTKRNMIAVLMGIELMLNAANINLVAFGQYDAQEKSGVMFSVFVIVIAAAEAAVALAIVLRAAKQFKTTDTDKINSLKG